MSSDDYFDVDSLQVNSAFLEEVDALEAGFTTQEKPPNFTDAQPTITGSPLPNDGDTTDYENFFDDFNPDDLQILDNSSSSARNTTKSGEPGPPPLLRQLTLFGDTVVDPQPSNSNRSTALKTGLKKVKHWDYSQPINSKTRSKPDSKGKVKDGGDEEEEEGKKTDAQNFDLSHDLRSARSPPSFKHKPDLLLAKHWIYPTNIPKRDYQFNIVRDSLFENSLISLPTGLGKTFIAGVIMLNYYRWFPEGKVVFLAPTKPLVAQQIDACHKICGIPGSHSIELTGHTVSSKRADFWREKRVFFMTPQTLMNDLKHEICNPTDVVLLVIDEAHRGTGDHAYAQIVRYLMIKNGHFRVLALTATPGSNPGAVQKIIDALHISRIEIRDENSLDLHKYILPKKITTHIIKMTEDIIRVRDLLVKIMNKVAKKIASFGLMPNLDVMKLHPYRCTAVQADCRKAKAPLYVYGVLNQLRTLAQAMSYLIECSLNMCFDHLQGSLENSQREVKKTKLAQEPLFQDVIRELERQRSKGFSVHPKVDKLIMLAVDYFATSNDEQGHNPESGRNRTSKMMIFANYRMVVDEIVSALNQHQPLIHATRFVGQGADKQGNKGIVQREQLEIIQRFKGGEFNVLVATSIGEEGLDIGEVDCIICYDAQKTPIRMLQRIGRTGRHRAGRVEVLLSETREETNWEKARNDYENTQRSIFRGDSLQLYADVGRLLPIDLKPAYQETLMPIEEYIRETHEIGKSSGPSKGRKRKVESAPRYHNIPPGGIDNFIPSSELLAGTSKKRRKVTSNTEKMKKPLKPRATSTVKSTGATKHRKKAFSGSTLSQLDQEMADDSDDKDIELGIDSFLKAKSGAPPRSSSVVCFSSSNSDVVDKPCLSEEEIEDHAWLLNSDPADGATHVSNQPRQQRPSQSPVNPSPSSSSEPWTRVVKPLGNRQRRRIVTESSPSRSNELLANTLKPCDRFLDLEAEVSGECSSDDSTSEIERDSDRRFLEELSPSQRPASYNQTMAYRQSLLTQAHPDSQVPEFRSGVIRQGPFGRARTLLRNVKQSSSPNRSTDQYSLDSFLVEDDDDILLTSHPSNS